MSMTTKQLGLVLDSDAAAIATPPDPPRCPKCRCTQYVDRPCHGGQSMRRDCARCNFTWGFSCWYGKPVDVRPPVYGRPRWRPPA
jgi:hypothetical protein